MHPGAISGIALLLLGLGLPRLVDAIGFAYGLAVAPDYGALPWLMLEGIEPQAGAAEGQRARVVAALRR